MMDYDMEEDERSGSASGSVGGRGKMRRSDAPLYMLMLFILVLVVLTLSEIAMVKHGASVAVGRGGFHMTKRAVHDHHKSEHLKIESLLPGNVPSMELSKRLWYQEFHQLRIQNILRDIMNIEDAGGFVSVSEEQGRFNSSFVPFLPNLCPDVPPSLRKSN